MTIQIISWSNPKLLEGTGYTHGQEIKGTDSDALGIAMQLFMNGLNIRVTRNSPKCFCLRESGTEECGCPKIIRIAVDDQGFTQR